MFRKDKFAAIKKELKKTKQQESDLLNRRHMFDHLTLEGFAETIKRQFIICNTLYNEGGTERIWNNIDEVDSVLMDRIIKQLYESSFSASIIREISRNEPWRSHYSMNKDNPFNKPTTEYSDEQRTLIIFSKMYDSAREHPECPPDDIMDDDDMFDGWMIKERRKRESDRTANEMEQRIGKNEKIKNADNVFMMANSKDDARKIHMMNDFNARMIKKKREAAIKAQGEVKEGSFQDQKVETQKKSQEQFIKKVKGK